MAALLDRQWELDGRLLMGRGQYRDGTKYIVGTPEFGEPDRSGDPSQSPRGDGRRWGRGYRGGRTISLPVTVDGLSKSDGRDAAGLLEAAWDAEDIRSEPGAVSVLRWNWAGQTRRAYGRTGNIAPTSDLDHRGRIDYSVEFDTVDHRYYGDTVDQLVIPYVPAELGGLIGDQIGDWFATTYGDASGQLSVTGSAPAWLVWAIKGPITNPTIDLPGQWSATLQTTVNYDQTVIVDPTPWSRSVRRNDGANLAGAFTQTSQRMSAMRVRVGVSQVLLRGVDPTGTSSLTCFVRPVWSTY